MVGVELHGAASISSPRVVDGVDTKYPVFRFTGLLDYLVHTLVGDPPVPLR